ncbi:alkyl sulfatase BDS1-like metallo-beta-lactamase superfamily hydrolase [Mycolicibacterium sp. 624]
MRLPPRDAGFDLANLTLLKGDTGWIVIDTPISPEMAKAGLDLANEKLGASPVLAVVHSHSHTDHYGGVRGIVSQQDVDTGKVKIIAPSAAFVEAAVSENVIASNAMSRRVQRRSPMPEGRTPRVRTPSMPCRRR